MTLPFIVRTDASQVAVACTLLQYHDGVAHPVAYAGRKLLPREERYAIV